MSKHDKPVPQQVAPIEAVLVQVRLREKANIFGYDEVGLVIPFDRLGREVVVAGPSVFIAAGTLDDPAPETPMVSEVIGPVRQVAEIPRSACILRWLVPAGVSLEQFAKQAPHAAASSPGPVRRRQAARVVETLKADGEGEAL